MRAFFRKVFLHFPKKIKEKVVSKYKRGFTLIELLVVIAIVAILATLGAVIFTGVKDRALQSRRLADINAIHQALEAHYNPQTGEYQPLQGSYFASGSVPKTPEGEDYPISWNPDFSGFRVCTIPDCDPQSGNCSCQESSQGRYIAQDSPGPSPSSGPTPPAGSGPVVFMGADLYSDTGVRTLAKSGDQFVISAARQEDNPETPEHERDNPITQAKFDNSITRLSGINTSAGMVKVLMFSAVEDLDNFIEQLPSDVGIVSYNQEGGLSPTYEIGLPADNTMMRDHAIEFADKMHARWPDKKTYYGPTKDYFERLQSAGMLDDILLHADGVALQGQNILPTMTEDEFATLVQGKHDYVKGINPVNNQLAARNPEFKLQLWYSDTQQTQEQMTRVFNRLQNYIDVAGWGGAGSAGQGTLECVTRYVLSYLDWRNATPNLCP